MKELQEYDSSYRGIELKEEIILPTVSFDFHKFDYSILKYYEELIANQKESITLPQIDFDLIDIQSIKSLFERYIDTTIPNKIKFEKIVFDFVDLKDVGVLFDKYNKTKIPQKIELNNISFDFIDIDFGLLNRYNDVLDTIKKIEVELPIMNSDIVSLEKEIKEAFDNVEVCPISGKPISSRCRKDFEL